MNFPTYSQAVEFHGHSCPGLSIGYRMTTEALKKLNEIRAKDEQIVAIVENDACGVDAVQLISGCTFGKGNLIFNDFGKQVYTFFSRKTSVGIRVSFNGDNCPEEIRTNRNKFADWILSAPVDEMLNLDQIEICEPSRAKIFNSICCQHCGEKTMETRIRVYDSKMLCIPCFKKLHC